MFDWDEDQDDLIRTRAVLDDRLTEPATDTANRGMIRAIALRWFAPMAIVAVMMSAGISLFDPGLQTTRHATASLGGVTDLIFGREIGPPPADLVAYGPAQYENFMRAMGDFNDADLQGYAAATARDLGDHADPTTPFMLDVLLLTHREIERRGLGRPAASLRIDALRSMFEGAHAAL